MIALHLTKCLILLQTAQEDSRRLLDKLDPKAWERFGASGWGKLGNESLLYSTGTIKHATKAKDRLFDHYTNQGIEQRVENIYAVDYDNKYLDLKRVKVGKAEEHYKKLLNDRLGVRN